jgi:Peptidase family M28
VLDLRVYRAAFAPALIALFIAAFSLADRPAAVTTPLAPGFDGGRAYTLLGELADAYPKRPPGSAADRALAGRVAATFRDNGFRVTRRTQTERTVLGKKPLETVVGVRPGLSSHRIVIMAHRDSLGSPALAELSGTAALLEMARVFKVRELSSTLVLVSTSGGSAGGAGARAFAESDAGDSVDAAILLGDVAGKATHKPWIVPWSNGEDAAPMAIRRTLESAVRREVGAQAGGSRAIGQWARRALPLTVSEQGEAARAGLPAVLLQASGELGPNPRTPVSEDRIDAFGRAAMRAVTALDGPVSRADEAGPFADEPNGIVTVRRLLPDWAIRLLVGTLLLPPLVTAADAFFGARRRRLPVARWAGWVAAAAVPFLLTWLWIRLLGLTGAIDAPLGPVLPEALPLRGWNIVALLSAPLVLGLTWIGVRGALVARLRLPAGVSAGGAAAALGLVVAGLAVLVWLVNPFAAALLVPAAHAWLFAAAPGTDTSVRTRAALVLLGLVLPALMVLQYGLALALGPLDMVWLAVTITAGGHVTPLAALFLSVLAGSFVGVLAVVRTRRRVVRNAEPDPIRTRGPIGYAGPGSLGGTESALKR